MSKTPDEIKQARLHCSPVSCRSDGCPYRDDTPKYEGDMPVCRMKLWHDMGRLIQQLESDKKQLEGMLAHMNQLRDAAAGRALKMEERARQFEKDNDQLRNYVRLLQAERDAAVKDMHEAQSIVCLICKNYYQPDPAAEGCGCKVLGERFGEGSILCGMFEWRGVPKEVTS